MKTSKERFKELMELAQQSIDFFELHKNDVSAYEKQEDDEFVAKYHTKRPEYFNPPTWEDIQKNGLCYWYFVGKNKSRYVISIDLPYNKDLGAIFVANMNSRILVTDEYICTKENYYKAVERARKLFLGEKDA